MHYEEVLLEPGHYDDQSETLAGRHLVIHSAKGAASVSLFASVCVVLSYFFILWYQSSMANRISLRLIVFACLVNSIYNVMQLTVTSILDTSSSCRPAIYVVIATDIMCCMCLAMIGVNLVMILIVRINHPAKMEKYYYACIIIVSLLGLLIPLASNTVGGSPSGRMCWYFYYFVGRITRVFKWMWYYGCILFSIVLATICTGIIITKFARRQDLFGGTLDMASKGEGFGTEGSGAHRRPVRTGQKSTVIFRKVILRCICYPLIPLICKGCGVGIEAAGIAVNYIPIGVLTADALLGNLIGFFVSCIYFTDPPVLAVIRELFGRAKRRYVDEYCSAQLLRKQQPPQPSSAAFFSQGHNDSLEQLSGRASRRFFSADDVSTVSKHSSRSDMSLYAATLSPESSVYGNGINLPSRMNTRKLQEKAKALETVQGRTSVSIGIIANNTAKVEQRRGGGMASPGEIVRSASTGRRYTHPHINIGDPHGRIAELVSRVKPSAGISSSAPSTLSGSNGGDGGGRDEEEEEEEGAGVEEEEPGKEEEYYYYPFIRRVYQICFPCFIPKDKKDEFVHIMPMHLVRGDQSIRRTAMESMSMNEMWALNAVQQHTTIRRGASANSRGSRRAFNTIHGNAMDGQLEREGQPIQMVEPYTYPRFAMFVHWLLINVFRVKPTTQQDKERPIELVDVTARRVPTPLQPIMAGPSPNIVHTDFHNQNQQSRIAQIITEASNNSNKIGNGDGVEESIVGDDEDDEDQDNFFKRSSIRAVNFSPSNGGKTDPHKVNPESISRTASNTSNQNEEQLRHPSFGHENNDPKGKRPIMERLRSLEHEPPFVSLLPGKDNSSRKSVKSADGSPPSAEKFVVTITGTGGGPPTHQEVYPIHPADKPTKENNNQQHRPRIFRRVSDMSPQQWTKDKSLLQHVWGRGASPSKSIKIAKQFAERVGDTSIVKSMNNRHGSTSSPTSEDLSEGLSPPQSLQFQSPSPESSHSELYAQALDARPHHVTKKPKRKHSVDTIMSPTTQFDPSTAKTLMLDDFGMEHFVQPNDRPQPTETERRVIDQAVESIYGFSSGATRVIYVRSWDQDGMNRVVVREEPWDYDTVILRALQEF